MMISLINPKINHSQKYGFISVNHPLLLFYYYPFFNNNSSDDFGIPKMLLI